MSKIKELIDCIKNGEARKISKLFSSAVAVKASDKLDEVKKDLAKGMFTPKKKLKSRLTEDVLTDIQGIVDNNQPASVQLSNGESLDIDAATANVLLTVLNALDGENKQRMLDVMSSNAPEFLKVVDFAWKQVE